MNKEEIERIMKEAEEALASADRTIAWFRRKKQETLLKMDVFEPFEIMSIVQSVLNEKCSTGLN